MNLLRFVLAVWSLQAAPTPSMLHGVVVNGITKEPLVKASIALIKVGGGPNDARLAMSGSDGRFSIPDVAAGRYSMVITHPRYVRFVYGQKRPNEPGRPNEPAGIIEVTNGQRLEDFTVEMIPTGVIAGRVFNQAGEPLAEITVHALKAVYWNGQRNMSIVKEVQTNDLGEYRLSGLSPGQYFVSASSPPPPRIEGERFVQQAPARSDGTPASTSATSLQNAFNFGRVDPSVIAGEIYPDVYSPNTMNPAAAAPLAITPGETSDGIDLTMTRVSQVFIRGRIVNDTGLAAQIRSVGLTSRGTESRFSGRTAGVSNGSFEFNGLAPGSYVLRAYGESAEGRLSSTAEVSTGNAGIENVQLIIHKSLTLSGRVRIEGEPESNNDPNVVRWRLILDSTINSGGLTADVKSDGTFSFTGAYGLSPEETYQLRLVELTPQPTNHYLKAAQLGPIDLLSSGIRLDHETNAQLEVVLSANAATLDCLVVDERHNPAAKATLVLVPDPVRRRISELYKSGTTDGFGRLRIEGIVPGDYKVFAWSDIESGAWEDPDILRIYESQGEPIHFYEGANLRVNVRPLN